MTHTPLLDAVARYWGYTTLRPLQREAMDTVLAGRDSIVVLPTGGGKSLCFQLPALVRRSATFLAVVIGGIGVMNTMIMSIFERTREIGVLRAVGWRRSRVLRMIVAESVTLCLLAGFVGGALGAGIASLATRLPAVGDFLAPAFPPRVFVQGALVAFVVGLLGAAYPAIRATRLTPMEALRHE